MSIPPPSTVAEVHPAASGSRAESEDIDQRGIRIKPKDSKSNHWLSSVDSAVARDSSSYQIRLNAALDANSPA